MSIEQHSHDREALLGPDGEEMYRERLRWWCSVCEVHRVRLKGTPCPVCIDEAMR
jgi:hypothetical protein